jgi:hypothetical protein
MRFTFNSILSLIIAIIITAACVIPMVAQTGSLRLEGIIWDPSGNPLSGAELTAIEESTGQQSNTVSDSDGYYRFLALQPGKYTVTAKAKGFKDVVHRELYLFTPGSTQDNFGFEVSAIDKEIGPGENARVLDSNIARSFSQREVEALPLLNRDPLALLVFQPGVQTNGGSEELSTVNGTRSSMNSIGRDGISINDPVAPHLGGSLFLINPDSISDIQIITASGNAEYGGSGGSQVVLTSRPGTKTLSGSVYDYVRNENLNANEFFNKAHNNVRPDYTRNLFGGTISGRLGANTLVFGNFEGNRTDQKIPRNRLVLTSDAKTGLFQWYKPDDTVRTTDTVQSFDIAANDPRGIGIDPSIASLLAKTPDSNNTDIGDGLNTEGYSFTNNAYIHQEQINVRVDHDLNARHRLFFQFNWDRTNATDLQNNADALFPGQESGIYAANNFGFVVGSNYTLSPTMVNELRAGFSSISTDYKRPARSSSPMLLPNSWTTPLDPSFPQSYKNPAFEITDNLSQGKNLHAFKYGVTIRRTRLSNTDYSGIYPNITFGTSNGNAPASTIGPSEQSEISTADRQGFENLYNDLLGRVESIRQTFNSNLKTFLPGGTARDRNFAILDFSGFIQDNWKIRRNLTLNLGLRYEFQTVPKELNGFQGAFDRAAEISSTANISDFNMKVGSNWHRSNLHNFSPRAGFAWDIFETGSTVLRGAYGIYYDPLIGGITRFIDRNSYGLSQTIYQHPNASGNDDYRLSDNPALPQQPEPPILQPEAIRSTSTAIMDPNLSTPRVHQFHLTLERRLWGAIWEAGYTGTRGKKLFQYLQLNQTKTAPDFLQSFKELQAYRTMGTPVPASNTLVRIFGSPLAVFNALGGYNFDSGQVGIAADNLDLDHFDKYAAAGVSDYYLRNFPQFDKFLFGTNAAESSYDALRIGLRKSTNNFHLRAYYTWSKSLDNASADGSQYVIPSDSFQPKSDKSFSNFDRTHVLNVASDYALPFGRSQDSDFDSPKWVTALFAGWNLGTLWTYESGARFSVSSGLQNQYAGIYSLANLDAENRRNVGKLYKDNDTGAIYWIGPVTADQFSYPEAGNKGTSGRNSFVGPSYFNLDVVLHKKFAIRENQFLQFRMEAYNVFNNTRLGLPNTNLFDSNFGRITSTVGNPRFLQLALRYQF